MAKNAVTDWDRTAANNTDVGGIGIQGSSAITSGDDAMREIMAQVAELISSGDAGAAVAPVFPLFRDSASPAASDILGSYRFQGRDSAGNIQDYGEIYMVIADVTHPTEDGTFHFRPLIDGVLTSIMTLNGSALTLTRHLDLSSSTGGLRLPQAAAPAPTLEGDMRWDTDDNLIVVGDGASAVTFTRVVALTPVATTSGTSHSFNIPSWAKEVVINFSGLSTNGTSALRVRVNGNSSGYVGGIGVVSGSPSYTAITDGFGLNSASATAVRHGQVRLSLIDSSNGTWSCSGNSADSGSSNMGAIAGSTVLSADLVSVSLTTVNGTDTFDAGKINVTYF